VSAAVGLDRAKARRPLPASSAAETAPEFQPRFPSVDTRNRARRRLAV